MKNYLSPVLVVTGYLIVYVAAIALRLNMGLILFMFSISPLLIFWMVYKVLTSGVQVDNTFEDKWYDDGEKRNQ